MIWIVFQFIFSTVSGMIIPETVSIPESTLVPPVQVVQTIDPIVSVAKQRRPVPEYLFVPSLNIAAAVHPVGLTEKGAVGVPSDPALLGWFEYGAIPGEQGSAIIDGHRGWRNKTPAVFDYLHEISLDDLVIVVDAEGNTLVFKVYDIKTYDPQESPEEVFLPDDGVFLNLITCNGEWDTDAGSATKRLVVFTEQVVFEDK